MVGQAYPRRQHWIHIVCTFWPVESQTVQLYNQVSHKPYNCTTLLICIFIKENKQRILFEFSSLCGLLGRKINFLHKELLYLVRRCITPKRVTSLFRPISASLHFRAIQLFSKIFRNSGGVVSNFPSDLTSMWFEPQTSWSRAERVTGRLTGGWLNHGTKIYNVTL